MLLIDEHFIHDAVTQVAEDNVSGAQSLTFFTADLLDELITSLPQEASSDDFLETIAYIGRRFVKAQPSMAPLRRFFRSLLIHLENVAQHQLLVKESHYFIERYVESLRKAKSRIAGHCAPLISSKSRVVTHSLSSLVVEAFREAKKIKATFTVIATESRPVYEGRFLSKTLSSLNIPVTLVIDAAAPGLLREDDILLLGADRITDSEFINKVGSYPLVMAAHQKNVPCYVLAASDKYLPESEEAITLSRGQHGEVWENAPEGVTVENAYFERIPIRLITGFICEDGIISYSQFANHEGPYFEPNVFLTHR